MIILSDCIKEKLDEGCIKVASTIAKKLKMEGARVISLSHECSYADKLIKANKILSNKEIYSEINSQKGNVLYIPFASNTFGSALRILMLSLRAKKKKINVLFALQWNMKKYTNIVLRFTKCRIIVLSENSYNYFRKELPKNDILYLKTGVDTKKFVEGNIEEKEELKQKYGIPADKLIITHIGHLKSGRNIEAFLDVEEQYHVVLVFSSVTEKEEDLYQLLRDKKNIQIIDDYIDNIAEIYQITDVYVFPTFKENNSIDVPLSVLEAASCNRNILTTPYKEIASFDKKKGLFFFDERDINTQLASVVRNTEVYTREIALQYDWDKAISELIGYID